MAKKKKSIFKFIWIALIVISISGLIILYLNSNKLQSTSNNQALVNHVPNFDNLTLNDLPNFSDFRDIHDYNGHVLVIGLNRIVEYDKEKNEFIRVSDPKVLGCIYDSTRIDKFLYVSCNSHFPDGKFLPEAKTIVASAVYKIDLDSGKIIKKYFGDELPLEQPIDFNSGSVFDMKGARANLALGSRGNILYMSSWDGVEKMDTKTEKITIYSKPNELKPGNELSGAGLGIPIGISSPIKTPEFKSISPLHDSKYYILASDGIYILMEGQFPQKIIDYKIDATDISKSTFSKDGQYLVFIGPALESNQGQILSYGVNVYLVDINKQSLIDLSKVVKGVKNSKTESLSDQISDKINNGYFEEDNGVISLKDRENKLILSLKLTNQKLEIMVK